jgi:hypothetical protein
VNEPTIDTASAAARDPADEPAHEPADGPGTAVADDDPWRKVFMVFVTVGIVVALVLGFREVIIEPVIRLDEVRSSERGVVPARAQVLARNSSGDTTYCIEVTITANDRDGQSLSTRTAEPTTGDGRLEPGRSANFVAVFDDLTDQELTEQLDGFHAFVASYERC